MSNNIAVELRFYDSFYVESKKRTSNDLNPLPGYSSSQPLTPSSARVTSTRQWQSSRLKTPVLKQYAIVRCSEICIELRRETNEKRSEGISLGERRKIVNFMVNPATLTVGEKKSKNSHSQKKIVFAASAVYTITGPRSCKKKEWKSFMMNHSRGRECKHFIKLASLLLRADLVERRADCSRYRSENQFARPWSELSSLVDLIKEMMRDAVACGRRRRGFLCCSSPFQEGAFRY